MTIDTLPAADAVRVESRLRPEQVSAALADAVALNADIAARIVKYRAVIEGKVAGVATSGRNQTIATEALQLRVLASLYGTAGQLNPAYWERAKELKAESADLIDDLTGSSADVPSNVSGAATLNTSRYAYDIGADSYIINA